ncbi:hypothetical protein DIPPA_10070 [Diplonema papillatum]|nr:hypothetical protein DIPPA_10070 [Diplonema papillatum]
MVGIETPQKLFPEASPRMSRVDEELQTVRRQLDAEKRANEALKQGRDLWLNEMEHTLTTTRDALTMAEASRQPPQPRASSAPQSLGPAKAASVEQPQRLPQPPRSVSFEANGLPRHHRGGLTSPKAPSDPHAVSDTLAHTAFPQPETDADYHQATIDSLSLGAALYSPKQPAGDPPPAEAQPAPAAGGGCPLLLPLRRSSPSVASQAHAPSDMLSPPIVPADHPPAAAAEPAGAAFGRAAAPSVPVSEVGTLYRNGSCSFLPDRRSPSINRRSMSKPGSAVGGSGKALAALGPGYSESSPPRDIAEGYRAQWNVSPSGRTDTLAGVPWAVQTGSLHLQTPTSSVAQRSWQQFVDLVSQSAPQAPSHLAEASLGELKALMRSVGIADPIECARIEVYWRLLSLHRPGGAAAAAPVAAVAAKPKTRRPKAAAAAAAAAVTAASGGGCGTPRSRSGTAPRWGAHAADGAAAKGQQQRQRTSSAGPRNRSNSTGGGAARASGNRGTAGNNSSSANANANGEGVQQQNPNKRRSASASLAGRRSWAPVEHPRPFVVEPVKRGPHLSRRQRLGHDGGAAAGACDPNDTPSEQYQWYAHLGKGACGVKPALRTFVKGGGGPTSSPQAASTARSSSQPLWYLPSGCPGDMPSHFSGPKPPQKLRTFAGCPVAGDVTSEPSHRRAKNATAACGHPHHERDTWLSVMEGVNPEPTPRRALRTQPQPPPGGACDEVSKPEGLRVDAAQKQLSRPEWQACGAGEPGGCSDGGGGKKCLPRGFGGALCEGLAAAAGAGDRAGIRTAVQGSELRAEAGAAGGNPNPSAGSAVVNDRRADRPQGVRIADAACKASHHSETIVLGGGLPDLPRMEHAQPPPHIDTTRRVHSNADLHGEPDMQPHMERTARLQAIAEHQSHQRSPRFDERQNTTQQVVASPTAGTTQPHITHRSTPPPASDPASQTAAPPAPTACGAQPETTTPRELLSQAQPANPHAPLETVVPAQGGSSAPPDYPSPRAAQHPPSGDTSQAHLTPRPAAAAAHSLATTPSGPLRQIPSNTPHTAPSKAVLRARQEIAQARGAQLCCDVSEGSKENSVASRSRNPETLSTGSRSIATTTTGTEAPPAGLSSHNVEQLVPLRQQPKFRPTRTVTPPGRKITKHAQVPRCADLPYMRTFRPARFS